MAKRKAVRAWKATEVIELLRARYSESGRFVFMEQAPNATGFKCNSWIDAVCFSLWPSDRLTRRSFEVKVSRSDFLREIENPSKNLWAREHFHEFWFVAPESVIKAVGELPEGDGWLAPRGDKLVVKLLPKRRVNPKLTEIFVSAMMRALANERTAMHDRLHTDFHKTDPQYLYADAFQRATDQFLTSRKCSSYFSKKIPAVEEIIERLTMATLDKENHANQQAVTKQLEIFQERMCELLDSFLVLAHASMLARDEAGKNVMQGWGYPDAATRKRLADKHTEAVQVLTKLSEEAEGEMRGRGLKPRKE